MKRYLPTSPVATQEAARYLQCWWSPFKDRGMDWPVNCPENRDEDITAGDIGVFESTHFGELRFRRLASLHSLISCMELDPWLDYFEDVSDGVCRYVPATCPYRQTDNVIVSLTVLPDSHVEYSKSRYRCLGFGIATTLQVPSSQSLAVIRYIMEVADKAGVSIEEMSLG